MKRLPHRILQAVLVDAVDDKSNLGFHHAAYSSKSLTRRARGSSGACPRIVDVLQVRPLPGYPRVSAFRSSVRNNRGVHPLLRAEPRPL